MAVQFNKSKATHEAKGYESIQALLSMNPADVDKIMKEYFDDNDPAKRKLRKETENNLKAISDDIKSIMQSYHNNTDVNLAWHSQQGLKNLKDIEENVKKIYESHKDRIESVKEFKEWFEFFKDVIFRVEQIWNESSSEEERKNALVKEGLNKINTVSDFLNRINRFENWIEEKLKRGEL